MMELEIYWSLNIESEGDLRRGMRDNYTLSVDLVSAFAGYHLITETEIMIFRVHRHLIAYLFRESQIAQTMIQGE